MHGSQRRRLAIAAFTAATALLATACQGSTPAATQLNPTAVASKPAAAVAKYLKISPAPGTKNASPAGGVTVTEVNGGKVTAVTVKASGDHSVAGALSGDKASWHSTYALPTGQSYTVTASGTGAAASAWCASAILSLPAKPIANGSGGRTRSR